MKKLLWTAATALAAVGLWEWCRTHRCCKCRVHGTVASVDIENKTFSVRHDNGTVSVFTVTPETGFHWLAETSGGQNKAVFSDLLSGTAVSVFCCSKAPQTAKNVVLEKVK